MNQQAKRELAILIGGGAALIGALLRGAQILKISKRKWPWALGGLGAAVVLLTPKKAWGDQKTFRDESVVITGGSRGLGLALAEELLTQGAQVTLLARDGDELERAEQKLNAKFAAREPLLVSNTASFSAALHSPQSSVFIVRCDVTKATELDNALAEARARFGKIDAFIHNAGVISVGPFSSLDADDFEAQTKIHLDAAVNATRSVRPYFQQNGGGRLIFVSSVGGKIPVPHMSAYSATKFALAGFGAAMATELRHENIHVMTAFPGLTRTGSPIQAVFKGDVEKEFAWFSLSDALPGLSMSAARAAKIILSAALDGQTQVTLGLPAKFGAFAFANFPELTTALLGEVARLLPKNSLDQTSHLAHHPRRTGAASTGTLTRWLKALGLASTAEDLVRRSERDHNQQRKFDADANLGVHP